MASSTTGSTFFFIYDLHGIYPGGHDTGPLRLVMMTH
jgi:hypothetical protein